MNSLFFGGSVLAFLMVLVPLPEAQSDPSQASGLDKDAVVARAAKDIDRLIEKQLKADGRKPNPIADDATFARRSYLEIVGRIPTRQEAWEFLSSKSSDKRAKLVDQLIASPGRTSHRLNWWADLLRAKSRLNGRLSGEPFLHFLKQALHDNMPYDLMVKEMLAASGPAHQRDNGATGYLMRDSGMPLDNLANTMRLFAGTRIECAQCHDHPFDQWTQMQFYRMAAYTGGIQYRTRNGSELSPETARVASSLREIAAQDGRNGRRAMFFMLRPLLQGVSGSGNGLIRLPKDYRYEDGRPNQLVKASVVFGDHPQLSYKPLPKRRFRPANERNNQQRRRGRSRYPEIDSRQAFADWLASPENPRFTRTIANRLHALIMGRGLIDPVDDLREDQKSANPELLAYLEQLMVDLEYDLLAFERALFRTKFWQRESTSGDREGGENPQLEGPLLRRMSAEQIWDSLLTLTVDDVEGTLGAPSANAEATYRQYEELLSLSDEELKERYQAFVLRYKDPKAFQQKRRELARKRAQKMRAPMEAVRKKMRELRRARNQARRKRDKDEVKRIEKEIRTLTEQTRAKARQRRRNRGGNRLARASELSSPAPARHLLREFGQSDREQTDGAYRDANVPQVLNLLNGFTSRFVRQPNTQLMKDLDRAGGAQAKIRRAYMAILGRAPRKNEVALWSRDMQRDSDQTVEDLVWTLLNTHEFRFVH